MLSSSQGRLADPGLAYDVHVLAGVRDGQADAVCPDLGAAEHGIVGITRRRRRSLTKQDTTAAPAPDLIGRDFTAHAPGQRLVGDITYLPTGEGWLYLATTIDLYNREVVGHAMAEHMRSELVTDAVELAHRRGLIQPDAIFHSDRGPGSTPRPPTGPR